MKKNTLIVLIALIARVATLRFILLFVSIRFWIRFRQFPSAEYKGIDAHESSNESKGMNKNVLKAMLILCLLTACTTTTVHVPERPTVTSSTVGCMDWVPDADCPYR
jgi:hypothetical protein